MKGKRSHISGFFGGLLVVFFSGASFVIVPTIGLKATDSTEFCVSCHTMKHLYEETKLSRHYSNSHGVRVGCSDCHVPHETMAYLERKLFATKDLFFEIIRPAKTKEEYEEIRPRLVRKVREDFLKDDSANCRRCHAFENFDVEIKAHQRAIKEGITCIACHYNLAHGEVPWPEMEEES